MKTSEHPAPSPAHAVAPAGIFDATTYYSRGNAPRRWQDYLAYPRVLFTLILCIVALVLHVAFGIYVWFFE
jgi:hypothetical protein